MTKNVEHPSYYGGEDNPYEAIKVIEALDFDFHLGNAFKYMVRWKKRGGVEDLRKARFYLNRRIEIAQGQTEDQ